MIHFFVLYYAALVAHKKQQKAANSWLLLNPRKGVHANDKRERNWVQAWKGFDVFVIYYLIWHIWSILCKMYTHLAQNGSDMYAVCDIFYLNLASFDVSTDQHW